MVCCHVTGDVTCWCSWWNRCCCSAAGAQRHPSGGGVFVFDRDPHRGVEGVGACDGAGYLGGQVGEWGGLIVEDGSGSSSVSCSCAGRLGLAGHGLI